MFFSLFLSFRHIILKQKNSVVGHLVLLENTALDESILYRAQFGMVKRHLIVSKKNHDRFYETGIHIIPIQVQEKKENLPKPLD